MDEVLTIEEMKVRYAPERVLIGDPETDEALRIRAGKVLGSHNHRNRNVR